jgi:hypothetical protein
MFDWVDPLMIDDQGESAENPKAERECGVTKLIVVRCKAKRFVALTHEKSAREMEGVERSKQRWKRVARAFNDRPVHSDQVEAVEQLERRGPASGKLPIVDCAGKTHAVEDA